MCQIFAHADGITHSPSLHTLDLVTLPPTTSPGFLSQLLQGGTPSHCCHLLPFHQLKASQARLHKNTLDTKGCTVNTTQYFVRSGPLSF